MQLRRLGIDDSVSVIFPPDRLAAELSDVGVEVTVGEDPGDLAECDAVVTFAHRGDYLETADWVHSIQAGYDRFPLAEFEARDVALTNSTGVHYDSVGETVASYVLAFARRLHDAVAAQQRRAWDRPEWHEPFTVAGESICVVGLGALGRGIADRAAGLGMDVTGVKRTPEDVPGVGEVYPSDEYRDAIADARFVALAVPLTDETEGMIGEAELDAMRDDAYLLNVARGDVVDQDALVAALEADRIAGAALDVFEEEPLPENSPLWGMDEVIVTPHTAGATRDYAGNVAELVRENAGRIADGEELHNRVV
ncbi:D-2-hydroxyacid dehydrogenase [Halostella litorea]|uniref:D-2-hydroxyacid dehydrogenase n=1 Tax=Halostella litorea TaxID=2528831 RepID=UPI001092F980|nr:D-2-hydroxyacid dehydrogenase [Halostella litorea]